MIAVIFELVPKEGVAPRYFTLAERLRTQLESMDGFLYVERFESLTHPGRFLSLSFWRDEDAVRAWRCHGMHRSAQQEGRSAVLATYRLRVASVVRDYGLDDREAVPSDSQTALI